MGRGSEYIRQAACRLIECVALSHLTLSGQQKKPAEAVPADPKKRSLQDIRNKRTLSKTKREIFMETIDENLKHTKEEITVTAVAAFGAFTTVSSPIPFFFPFYPPTCNSNWLFFPNIRNTIQQWAQNGKRNLLLGLLPR